jgi:proteic killer suppression protein
MIRSFKRKAAAAIFEGKLLKGFPPDLFKTARRKLEAINAATSLEDLRVPPGNRLEALSGARAGQHSIRINDQWRVCFVWTAEGAENVEIVDYH